jgi:hypothetical protein
MKKLLTSIVLIAALLFSAPCFAGLDPAEEARHAELKRMCAELKVPAPPEIFIRFQVHDKDGKLIFDDKQRGHSWLRNFYNGMTGALVGSLAGNTYGAGYLGTKDITGGAFANNSPKLLAYAGGAGSTSNGIVVGTDDTAFSAEQYKLLAIIANGSGAGQFAYSAESAITASYVSGTKTWVFTKVRAMNNNSGGEITVKEIGLHTYLSNSPFCLERSVLSPAVAVPNGAQLTVTYEISMDFSAIDP